MKIFNLYKGYEVCLPLVKIKNKKIFKLFLPKIFFSNSFLHEIKIEVPRGETSWKKGFKIFIFARDKCVTFFTVKR